MTANSSDGLLCLYCGCAILHDGGRPWCPSCVEGGVDFGNEAPQLRPELLAFAQRMERVLRANDHKGGWRLMSVEALFNRAVEELDELQRAMKFSRDPAKIAHEAIDVANFMLMIADNAPRIPQFRRPTPNTEATP
jgi:NTP pyrophosphatase (non-canonical NTP hydrolase)